MSKLNWNQIENAPHVIIYGAKYLASLVFTCLTEGQRRIPVDCYAVTDASKNVDQIGATPVFQIEDIHLPKEDTFVFVAANFKKKVQDEIVAHLLELGYREQNILVVTWPVQDELRKNYILEEFRRNHRTYHTIEALKPENTYDYKDRLKVYMAKCHLDKKVDHPYELPDWIERIQVGTELTDFNMGFLADNMGENISAYNADFCELTATYWIWKHSQYPYVGLCHYRRPFNLTDQNIRSFIASDMDVLLTTPGVILPAASYHYARFAPAEDVGLLRDILGRRQPEYLRAMDALFQRRLFYHYNMLIAKKKVFDTFCEWLFPILFEMYHYYLDRGIERKNRYIGYVAENLTSVYFLKNADSLKIVHADILYLNDIC